MVEGATVLVVDDEANLRKTLLAVLQRSGYQAIPADNAREALEQLNKKRVDLIILDLQLPDLDGLSLMKEVVVLFPKIPILIFTGNGSLNSIEEATRLGARGYLLKPADPNTITRRVAKILKQTNLKERQSKVLDDMDNLLNSLNDFY